MPHSLAVVAALTIGLTLASIFGFIAQKCKLPTILGFLLAGFIIGPYSPGYVADLEIAEQLAEIGVILMLFGVGLHFKLEDLMNVKNIAIPGATVQTLAAAVVATLIVHAFGWSWEPGIIIGLSIGVASTVVLVRVLSDNHLLNTQQGHIAVGWLVVEDIFTVIILILLPTLAAFSQGENLSVMGVSFVIVGVVGKFLILALLMFTWGHKTVSYLLNAVARLRSQELFTLTTIALVFAIAVGSTVIFGTSIALGAFLAGMVVGKTSVRHQASAHALPLKDLFAVIFFLSVGMLFNPQAILDNFMLFIGIIFVILVIKPLSAFLITVLLKYPVKVAVTVAIALAQIGEFSFILAEEAMNLKLLPDEGFDLLVACSLITISINPMLFQLLDKLEQELQKTKLFLNTKQISPLALKNKDSGKPRAVVIGFGPIGRDIVVILGDAGYAVTTIEHNIDTVAQLESKGSILFGDAADASILKSAGLDLASLLIITIPETEKTIDIIHSARRVNPYIDIVARVQYITDRKHLDELKVQYVCTENEALKAFTYAVWHLVHPTAPKDAKAHTS